MHIHTIQLNIEKLRGGTSHMDATEFGAYLCLLICAYQANNKLPNDDKRLALMAKCSIRIWKRIKPVIEQKWDIRDGYWTHREVSKQLETYQKLSHKNRSNALKKNKTDKPLGKPDESQNEANTNNYNLITNISNKDKSLLESSELHNKLNNLWLLYPSVGRGRGHKGKFFEQIKKHLAKGIDYEKIRDGVASYARYCTETGELNQDAFRWARDRGWETDYPIGAQADRLHKANAGRASAGSFAEILDAAEKAKEMLRRQAGGEG